MVQNSDHHVESSSSRDEINVSEAEDNILPIDHLNGGVEAPVIEPEGPQQQLVEETDPPNNADVTSVRENNVPTQQLLNADEAISSEATDYDDEPDETLSERLLALADMFPEPIRGLASRAGEVTKTSIRKVFRSTCRATWIICTSALILIAPVAFENERVQIQEFQKIHEKQALFGPGTVVAPHSGGRIMAR